MNQAISMPLLEWLHDNGLLATAAGKKREKREKRQHGRTIKHYPVGLNTKVLTLGVMRRLPKCEKQPAHCDGGFAGSFTKFEPEDVGLAIIVAVSATTIDVFPFDSLEVEHVLMLPGDILVLRSDCGHIGDSNTTDEHTLIIHGYLDSSVKGCQRKHEKDGAASTFQFKGYPWRF